MTASQDSLRQLLRTRWPLIQAPMAGVQGHALAAAVSREGALGSLPAAMLSPQALLDELAALRLALAAAPTAPGCGSYNLNFFCHTPATPDAAHEQRWHTALNPYFEEYGIDPSAIPAGPGRAPFSPELADLIEPLRPPVLSFHFGLPQPALLARVKAWGAVVLSTATTADEARWLQAQGADVIIAQGLEAGGHRGHFLNDDLSRQQGLFALLPQVVRAVSVPVVAAGGIADAAGISAALALGAAGVQLGTTYLLCDEATTSPLHRQVLGSPAAAHTALTRLLTGRPARGVVNRLMQALGPMNDAAPHFPLAAAALAPLRAAAEAQGRSDFSPLWAGQNTQGCQAIGAAELTRQLIAGFSHP